MASYKVSSEPGNIRLNEPDRVKSILQNIGIILSTRRGSIPLYRNFGTSWENFVDRPVHIMKALAFAEMREAIQTYEPRAELLSINFLQDQSDSGHIIFTAEVEIPDE